MWLARLAFFTASGLSMTVREHVPTGRMSNVHKLSSCFQRPRLLIGGQGLGKIVQRRETLTAHQIVKQRGALNR